MTRLHHGPADGGLKREIHTGTVAGGATTLSIKTGLKRIIMAKPVDITANRATMTTDWTTTPGTVAFGGLTAADVIYVEVLGH